MKKICPLCGQDAFRRVWQYRSLESGCCEACGHVYSCSSEPVDYQSFSQSYDAAFLQQPDHPLFTIARHRINTIRSFTPLQGKMALEAGCGYGHFLKMLQEEGATVSGYEPSAAGGEFAERYFGLSSVKSSMFNPDDAYEHAGYDLIAAFHMLEHTQQPKDFIDVWSRMLRPGGLLVIAVPNLYHLQRDLHELYFIARGWHRHSFAPGILRGLVEKAGLRVVHMEDEPVNTMSPNSLLLIASKEAAPLSYDYDRDGGQACELIADFHNDLDVLCQSIADWVIQRSQQGKRVAIFGAGLHTEALLALCSLDGRHVSCLLDDDEGKQDISIDGVPVMGVHDRLMEQVDCVLVSSLAAEEKMLNRLRKEYPAIETVGIYQDLAVQAGLN